MTRPDDFTEADVAGCDAEMDRLAAEQRAGQFTEYGRIPEFLFSDPGFREVWYSGYWLGRKLEAAGCSVAERKRVCFLHGRLSLGSDPWYIATELLARWLEETQGDRN
jgi:hypothetical protein